MIKTADDVPVEEDEMVDIDDEEGIVDVSDENDVDIADTFGDDKSASSLQEATSPSSSAAIASILVPVLSLLLSIFSNLIQ